MYGSILEIIIIKHLDKAKRSIITMRKHTAIAPCGANWMNVYNLRIWNWLHHSLESRLRSEIIRVKIIYNTIISHYKSLNIFPLTKLF